MAHLSDKVPDTADAAAFLQAMNPEGPWHLVAMKPDQTPRAKTFDSDELEEMLAWIEARQGTENLYFHVNYLMPRIRDKKATKADVQKAIYLHVDVDDLGALNRVRHYSPAPTVVVFSGGGYQAFWRLSEDCFDLDRIERCNKAIAASLGGDKCHNVDRIMRLPGTINVPNAKKREAGREPTWAYIVDELTKWERVYSIDEFSEGAPDPSPTSPQAPAMRVTPIGLDELPLSITAAVRAVIKIGDDPGRPRNGEAPKYPSRSEVVFHVACELARAGCSEEIIAGVLTNRDLGISASVTEKRNPVQYALRQARSARAAIEEGWPDCDKRGNPLPTMRNSVTAIRRLGISCAYDRFRMRKVLAGNQLEDHQGEISDDACMLLRGMILAQFGFDPRSDHVRDAISLLCLENAFHPIQQMLDGLIWDGVPRIDRWMTTYLGAEDTALNCAISRIVLIAAIRRVRQPGAKFDQVVVLEGPQGTGKSSALVILAGPGNHSDQEIITADTRTQMEMLQGIWIYELGEIEGFNKAEINKIKAFVSRTADRSRMAYAHYAVERPRQAIFIGTTNEAKYLRDQTGNRRFWPVKTGSIDLETLRRDRDQLWAEAASREAQGEPIVLPKELWAIAAIEQAERLEDDPWLEKLAGERGTAHDDVVRVYTQELLAGTLQIPPERQTQAHTKRLATLMRKLGWEAKKFNIGGQTIRGYERPKPDGHYNKPTF
jgi:energy-coupling factor transporter ATP-binding protein EcfA2